jgi:hypothetical protein
MRGVSGVGTKEAGGHLQWTELAREKGDHLGGPGAGQKRAEDAVPEGRRQIVRIGIRREGEALFDHGNPMIKTKKSAHCPLRFDASLGADGENVVNDPDDHVFRIYPGKRTTNFVEGFVLQNRAP